MGDSASGGRANCVSTEDLLRQIEALLVLNQGVQQGTENFPRSPRLADPPGQ